MLSNCTPQSLACRTCAFVLFALSFLPISAFSQTAQQPEIESWFGWMESPSRHLRTIVNVNRDEKGIAIGASLISPDESLKELPLNEFVIDSNGAWRFEIANTIAAQSAVKFSGVQTSPNQVNGELEQSSEKLTLNLQKVGLMPETRNDLGADSVWLGSLNFGVKKLDFRIRVYSSPPFALESNPKFLFDLLTQISNF